MKLATVVILALIGQGFSNPVSEEGLKPTNTELGTKTRQDEDGDGVGEIEQVGEQVSKIINGVLTGNLAQIFGGSTGFITDSDTQIGVDNILVGVSNPLNTILAQTVKQGQQYYNITTSPPPTLQPPPQPALVVVDPVTQPQLGQPQQQSQPLDPIVIQQPQQQPLAVLKAQQQPVAVVAPVQQVPPVAPVVEVETEAPVPEIVTANPGEDEDEDSETDAKLL